MGTSLAHSNYHKRTIDISIIFFFSSNICASDYKTLNSSTRTEKETITHPWHHLWTTSSASIFLEIACPHMWEEFMFIWTWPKPQIPWAVGVAFGLSILFCFLAPKVYSPPVPEIHETSSCPYQSPHFFVAASDEFLTSKTFQKQKKRTPLITGHLYFLLIFKQTFHTQKSNQVKTNEIK